MKLMLNYYVLIYSGNLDLFYMILVSTMVLDIVVISTLLERAPGQR